MTILRIWELVLSMAFRVGSEVLKRPNGCVRGRGVIDIELIWEVIARAGR